MKITDLETFVVGNPPPRAGGRYFIFVKLTTDDDIVGYGECYTAQFAPHVVEQMVHDTFERHVQGNSPFNIETMWRRVYGTGYSLRPDVSLLGVLSGLEIACWDIVGKACNKPVYDLLGGMVNERLRTYTYIYPESGDTYPDDTEETVYTSPDLAAERALHYVEQGFTAVKFDPADPYTVFDPGMPSLEELDRSERFVKAIREAVGTRADMLFGTHGQFTPAGALRMARRLEPYDPLWFEEPTGAENPAAMAKVAAGTTVPLAAGERLCTKQEFARLLEANAAAILQPNLGRVGGILEAKKVAAIAEAHYAQIAPHLYCGPLVGAANIQLATCIPNFLILESIEQWGGFHAELLKTPVRWEEGYVIPSREPGIGVELNEEVARSSPYSGSELQLEIAPDPIR